VYSAIANNNFNCVRLPFAYNWWNFDTDGYRAVFDQLIAWANNQNLYIIPQMHFWTGNDFSTILGMPQDRQAWIDTFVDMARRWVSNTNVLLEIGHRPADNNYGDLDNWNTWAQQCVTAIRNVNSDIVVVVPVDHAYPDEGNTKAGRYVASPITGGNVIYSFEMYWRDEEEFSQTDSVSTLETYFSNQQITALSNNAPVLLSEFAGFNDAGAEITFIENLIDACENTELHWIFADWRINTSWTMVSDWVTLNTRGNTAATKADTNVNFPYPAILQQVYRTAESSFLQQDWLE
jgi:hypothetical protein